MGRQIIGYRPDGRPIEGPPASAGRARVPLGTLGTPEPPTPPDGVLGWLRSLREKSGEGLEGLAELAAGVAKDKLDRDIQIIQSVADATKRGVKWSGEFLSGLKEDVQGLTPESALSATDAFGSMFTGRERTVPAQNNRLDQASAAAGVILSLMDPSPAGELKAARGLYSRVDDLVKLIPAKGAHPNRVLSIMKSGASGEELAYRGVPEFLAQQGNTPVTPAMLAEHLKANPAPMPKAKVLGKSESHFTLHSKHGIRRGIFPTEADAKAAMTEAGEYTLPAWSPDPPKYATYQVPGGENYRETLLTLPNVKAERLEARLRELEALGREATPDQKSEWASIMNRLQPDSRDIDGISRFRGAPEYRSSHYPDDPNIVVHVRSNQRTLPKLGRGEFIEEVQSDWYQQGKQKGYYTEADTANTKVQGQARDAERAALDQRIAARFQELGVDTAGKHPVTLQNIAGGFPDPELKRITERLVVLSEEGRNAANDAVRRVPDGPFKDSWPDLALKQKLLEVADDPDAQWIGFTGAGTQIKRYGTEQMTWAEIPGRDGYAQRRSWRVKFEPQVGGEAEGIADLGAEAIRRGLTKDTSEIVHSQEELSVLLGGSDVKAEKAWKRMQAAPEVGAYRPRAEGMVEFYDKQLVSKINKIIKPFGGVAQRVKMGEHYAWVVKLTPEMKVKIREAGLPLMSVVAATGAAMQQKKER